MKSATRHYCRDEAIIRANSRKREGGMLVWHSAQMITNIIKNLRQAP